MLTSARFHDMCCFTCTYAYVRACVTSENKAFMLVPTPGRRFQRLELGNNQMNVIGVLSEICFFRDEKYVFFNKGKMGICCEVKFSR